jgi:hypothetical protein
MTLDLSRRFSVPKDVMAREVGDETVILDLSNGTYYGLDSVGTRVWMLVGQGLTLDEVCNRMLDEFEVDRDTLAYDVSALVNELLSRSLLAQVDQVT